MSHQGAVTLTLDSKQLQTCSQTQNVLQKINKKKHAWLHVGWSGCVLSLPSSSHLQRVGASLYKVRVLSRPAVHLQTNRKWRQLQFCLSWRARRGPFGPSRHDRGRAVGKPWSPDRSCRGRSPPCRRSARSLWRGELRMPQTPAIRKKKKRK